MANPFPRVAVASSSGGTGAIADNAATGGISFSTAKSEISAGMQGRVSLAMLDFIIIAMVGFYWWTRNAQGGS